MPIELVRGDITKVETEAIVNAANNELWMGAGVAGAIKRAGGAEIERQAVAQGPIEVGESVVTTAGRLPHRYVIHAAAMGTAAGEPPTDAGRIRAATRNALRRAEELGLRSVAFPALGTGVAGFPLEKAAKIMVEEIRDHLLDGTSLERVVLALWGDEAFGAFAKVLGEAEATP